MKKTNIKRYENSKSLEKNKKIVATCDKTKIVVEESI